MQQLNSKQKGLSKLTISINGLLKVCFDVICQIIKSNMNTVYPVILDSFFALDSYALIGPSVINSFFRKLFYL